MSPARPARPRALSPSTRPRPIINSYHISELKARRMSVSKSHVKLRITIQQQMNHLFICDQRARLPSRAMTIHSRVRRIQLEHAHTPQHQNTKCLVRATRAGGSRQHDRQVVRYQDAFSVALRSQTAGSDKLRSGAQKGTASSASCNNQPNINERCREAFVAVAPISAACVRRRRVFRYLSFVNLFSSV